jgi:hypothetical protein
MLGVHGPWNSVYAASSASIGQSWHHKNQYQKEVKDGVQSDVRFDTWVPRASLASATNKLSDLIITAVSL